MGGAGAGTIASVGWMDIGSEVDLGGGETDRVDSELGDEESQALTDSGDQFSTT